jgi:hypothetical protein
MAVGPGILETNLWIVKPGALIEGGLSNWAKADKAGTNNKAAKAMVVRNNLLLVYDW